MKRLIENRYFEMWINKVRRYYLNTNMHLTKMTATIPVRKAVDAMIVETRKTKKTILPIMERDLQSLEEKLKKYHINV